MVCVCVCARACVHACVHAFKRASVHACYFMKTFNDDFVDMIGELISMWILNGLSTFYFLDSSRR